MSTRGTISVLCTDKKWRTIYCHYDSYLTGVGQTLLQFYNNQERAEALVILGDISSLDKSIECPPGHSIRKPINGYTVAYGRDGGETRTECRIGDNPHDNIRGHTGYQDYNYFWDGIQWSYSKWDDNDDTQKLEYAKCGLKNPNEKDEQTKQAEAILNIITSSSFKDFMNSYAMMTGDIQIKQIKTLFKDFIKQ